MSVKKIGVLGFGSPIVDDCVCVPESYLNEHGIPAGGRPGHYPDFVKKLLANYESTFRGFGGSIVNVIKGISMLGYRSGLVGVCSDDDTGQIIMDGMKKYEIENFLRVKPGHDSSRVVVCVHPSSQRTMFGIFDSELRLEESDVSWEGLTNFECLAFEGYSFRGDENVEVCERALKLAKENNQKIIMVLSDIFWADNYKSRLKEFIPSVSLLSGTEDEYKQLFDIDDRQKLLDFLKTMHFDMCAVTMGDEGAYVIQNGNVVFIPIEEGIEPVDTVGAGDYFAAGMFYSHLQGYDMNVCGKVGAMIAGSIVSKLGNLPDPEVIERIHKYLSTQTKVK